MDYEEMVECVRIGLGHEPSKAEIGYWLYGPSRIPRLEDKQIWVLERDLKEPGKEWRLQVLGLIRQIPFGTLISYGDLAKWANKEYGTHLIPQNIGWLRKEIYLTIGHDTDIPIHRIANEGDTNSTKDKPVTQEFNRRKRMAEGSLDRPHWYKP